MNQFMRFVRRNPQLTLSVALLAAIVLTVSVLPIWLSDTSEIDPANRLLAPSSEHLLGTDSYGRDVFSRLITGGRFSLGLAALITMTAGTLGTIVGLCAGYFRPIDAFLMRVMDAGMAFPAIVLAMSLAVAFGAGLWTEVVALTIIFTPFIARVVRSRALSVSAKTFIDAARASGTPSLVTLLRHVLPNVLPLAVVQLVVLSAKAMLIDGALSFLGLGIAPPTPTWGNMIAADRDYMQEAPGLVIFPGLALLVCVLLLNVIGSNLQFLVDPHARSLQDLQKMRARKRRRTVRNIDSTTAVRVV